MNEPFSKNLVKQCEIIVKFSLNIPRPIMHPLILPSRLLSVNQDCPKQLLLENRFHCSILNPFFLNFLLQPKFA